MKSVAFAVSGAALTALIMSTAPGMSPDASPSATSPAPSSASTAPVSPLTMATQALRPVARAEASQEALPTPAAGEFVLLKSESGTTLVANEAWRRPVLKELAKQHGFELEDATHLHPNVSLSIANASLETLLALLLNDEPYALRYALAEGASAASVSKLEIGTRDALAAAPDDAKSGEGLSKDEKRAARNLEREARIAEMAKRPPRDPAERAAAMERRKKREERRHQEELAELLDPDPEVRARAAGYLEVEDSGDFEVLSELMNRDPDPRVRAKIAGEMAFAENATAVDLLVDALNDIEPSVISAAADSLAFIDDPESRPALQELLEHPATEVRKAAEDALYRMSDES